MLTSTTQTAASKGTHRQGELSMNKKSVVSIVIGLLLTVTNTVVTIATREDWLTSNWLSRSNGTIAALLVWPPICLWAWRSRDKHKTLSYIIMFWIAAFCIILCCFILFV